MLKTICTPLRLDDRDVVLTASIGMAVTSDPAANPEDLISDADAAMYRAKERGRNRLEMFDEVMRTRALSTLETENDLRRAADEGELRLHFQPVLTLQDELIVGAEALVRWAHPTRGLLFPSDFIPLAEETGLIVPIGEWILDRACAEAARWARSSARLAQIHVGVNLSGRQLAQPDLPDKVAEALGRSGLSPSRLFVEITESVLMDGTSPATSSLAAIQEMGVTVMVDDFGTGYSSLTYLRAFPIDGLKLDRTFVAGLGHDAADTAIVESVIAMAHALGLRVVAEGVETEEQLRALADLGCDLGQGFYWSAARPSDELEELAGVRGSHLRALVSGPGRDTPRAASG
jgi:EAL domain-containing protein (putative c-di-GMP-specific phosphodiesterase class I)